jgi:predicted metal-dependent hydrolase
MRIGSLEVDVVRKNIKNLYIRVEPPDGQVRIVCPQKLDDLSIREFAGAKIDWINCGGDTNNQKAC